MLHQIECERAMKEAVEKFDHIMAQHLKGKGPVEKSVMARLQEEAHMAALDHYKQNALFDDSQEYPEKLAVSGQHIQPT